MGGAENRRANHDVGFGNRALHRAFSGADDYSGNDSDVRAENFGHFRRGHFFPALDDDDDH